MVCTLAVIVCARFTGLPLAFITRAMIVADPIVGGIRSPNLVLCRRAACVWCAAAVGRWRRDFALELRGTDKDRVVLLDCIVRCCRERTADAAPLPRTLAHLTASGLCRVPCGVRFCP